jgi:GT2 family glycosyltransferase
VGGFACYERRKLVELGGFSELLSPFHWEDVDLSYRAWKRGWLVLYEPRARALHQISATIDAHYSRERVVVAAIRNRLLFHWVNLQSRGFLLSHCWMLILKLLSRIWVWDLAFYRALFSALLVLPQVLPLRRRERRLSVRSDRELDGMFRQFWKSPGINIYHDRREVLERHPEAPGRRSSATPAVSRSAH